MGNFAHLHVHSHYTLLGATPSIDDLVQQAAVEGFSHLALTDTNVLYGAVAFTKACLSSEIQPIVGMAVTVAPLEGMAIHDGLGPSLLILLAAEPAGYRNLCRLSSHIQGSPDRLDRARRGVDWETLRAHRTGLVGLSGGRRGWIERALRAGDRAAAQRYAGFLAGLYDDQAYLCLEWHQPGDEAINREVTLLGARLGLPTVAVQPVYCMQPSHQHRLRLLAAIDHNCRLDQVEAAALPDQGNPAICLHWLSTTEVAGRLAAFPEASAKVKEVVGRCQTALTLSSPVWPAIHLPAQQTADQALEDLAVSGMAQRYGAQPGSRVEARLAHELKAIAQQGYAPLLLLVADIVHFAREQDIPVSTRGSVANSLVAYCTGITSVDPIEHDLLFERFLSPERLDPPDIDLDFCSRQRDQVLNYVRQTYGADRVALVATVSTMRLKSAIRETGKALGLQEAAINQLVSRLPRGWHPDPRRRSRTGLDELLAEVEKGIGDTSLGPLPAQVISEAGPLEHQPHHLSVHPGGVVITPGPLTDLVPVQWTAKGFLITQFDHQDVEAIGLPKIDLLGIRALTVLADAARLVRRDFDPSFRLTGIPANDPTTGDLLVRADTIGVFQCESSGARRTLRQLKARTVQDLAIANAFFKPGPATGGMASTFVRRYRGEEPVTFLHPSLAPILGPTKGVLIFQEQILRVATEIAGLSWQEADRLRRGMSKFKPEEMEAIRATFVAGCRRPTPAGPGFTIAQAETLWDQVAAFAGYGFNQGHATAYADVSYRSAYLKAHWPAAFLCARLADWGGFHHRAIYMAEAVRLGIPVHPPHINRSERRFALTWEPWDGRQTSGLERPPAGSGEAQGWPNLWMGLGQVRDLRRAAVTNIVQARQDGPFLSLRDLLNRVALQPKEVVHLIQCGALDGQGASRASLLSDWEDVQRSGSARQLALELELTPVPTEPASRRLAWETRILGQPVSVSPLEPVRNQIGRTQSLADQAKFPEQLGQMATYRLPGWTGGKGFFLSDDHTYAIAIGPTAMPAPKPWQPIIVEGAWQIDNWQGEWFQIQRWRPIEAE
jgi:DNA-directed DNA polymerase III PolC